MRRLDQAAVRPVAAEASLRGALLARAAGKLTLDAAMERLERLALTWHGGPVEDGITASLARLYLGAGRWRDAFTAVRRANAFAPNAAASQALTREAQAAFESLYLTEKGDALPGIQAVALFFDFRELSPIGRRGDEVVRRLADRLVGSGPARFRRRPPPVPDRQPPHRPGSLRRRGAPRHGAADGRQADAGAAGPRRHRSARAPGRR